MVREILFEGWQKVKRTNFPDKIIVHCSDSTFGDAATIDKWHKKRGWDGIGYHYVICRDGTIEAGRNVRKKGAHCFGQNSKSIGICLIGVDKFENIQLKTLKYFIKLICKTQNIRETEIYGHYHFSSKTCPNFNVEKFKDNL